MNRISLKTIKPRKGHSKGLKNRSDAKKCKFEEISAICKCNQQVSAEDNKKGISKK